MSALSQECTPMPELSPEQIQPKGEKGYTSKESIEFNRESMNTCYK